MLNNDEKQKQVELINTMKVKYWDSDFGEEDGESVIYIVTVEDNEFNRNVIKEVGYTDEEINDLESYRNGELDITDFAFKYANYFNGEKFSL